ncbi:MAG: hypothetical protein CL798_10790 [Chromatiales bacterium]|nr:hypothetical protein [Chromatiales bacterium]
MFAVSHAANAVQVFLVSHHQTGTAGTINTVITDGSHTSGIGGASTAVWDWDGTTLSSTGLYSAVISVGSSPVSTTILSDQITDLTIDTSTNSAGGSTSYVCVEGAFLSGIGVSGCGGHNFGTNSMNESTTVWGPGLATSQTIGGDDMVTAGGPRDITAYDFSLSSWDGTTLIIGNGVAVGSNSGGLRGEAMIFTTPVPAAAWLFGSALGLLGWARRRKAS